MFLLPGILLVKYFIYSGVFAVVNRFMPIRASVFKFGGIRILVGLFIGGFLFYFNLALVDEVFGAVRELLYFFSIIFWLFIWAAEWYFCFRLAYGGEIDWRLKRKRTLLVLAPAVLLSLVVNVFLAFFGLASSMSFC